MHPRNSFSISQKIPKKVSQQIEEDEATIQRRKIEEQLKTIKESIRNDFQKELQDIPEPQIPPIILPSFQQELNFIQSYKKQKQKELLKLKDLEQIEVNLTEETVMSEDIIEEKIENELQASRQLENVLLVTKREHLRIIKENNQLEVQLSQLDYQESDTYNIQFQAHENQKEAFHALAEVKKKISQIEQIENKYKDRKQQILEDLKKENDFYENALSRLRLQILEKKKENDLLELQITTISEKEEQRQINLNEQDLIIEQMNTLKKLEKLFLDGDIFQNGEDLSSYQEQPPKPQEIKSVYSFHQKQVPAQTQKIKTTNNLFITSNETEYKKKIPVYQECSILKSQKKIQSVKELLDNQFSFFREVENFLSMHPDGLKSLIQSLAFEFIELSNEAGVVQKLYEFLCKEVTQLSIWYTELEKEVDKLQANNQLVTPQTQKEIIEQQLLDREQALDSGMLDKKMTINQYMGQDFQQSISRKNLSQQFSFYVYLNLVEYLARSTNMLTKIQDETSLISLDFEKYFQQIVLQLKPMKFLQVKKSRKISSISDFDEEIYEGYQSEKIMDLMRNGLHGFVTSIQMSKKLENECIGIINCCLNELKADYVCKVFVIQDNAFKILDRFKNYVDKSHAINNLTDFERQVREIFTLTYNEIHQYQQKQICSLFQMCVNLLKLMKSCARNLEFSMEKKNKTDTFMKEESAIQRKYMQRASLKLQSYLNREDQVINISGFKNEKSLTETKQNNSFNFIQELQSLSMKKRHIQERKRPQTQQTAMTIVEPTETNLGEDDQFDQERIKFKNHYECDEQKKNHEEKVRLDNVKYEEKRKKFVFNRLSSISEKGLQEMSHIRQIWKNGEVLFKIKQYQNLEKMGKQDLMYNLQQEKVNKEKMLKLDLSSVSSSKTSSAVERRKRMMQVPLVEVNESTDSDKKIHGFFSGNPTCRSKGTNRSKPVQSVCGIERPLTQQAAKRQIYRQKMSKEEERVTTAGSNQQIKSKYSIEGMAQSPYFAKTTNQLSRYFSGDLIKRLKQ